MPGHPFFWLDVFAEAPLSGNGLAVVLEADGLTDETMLAFARETGLSETTFVQSASAEAAAAGADYRNRIWTIAEEIPFAGHPSLGTAVAVALGDGLDEASLTQETRVGLQRVDVFRQDEAWLASVVQEPAEFGEVFPPERVAPALGIDPDLIDSRYSSQLVSTGLPALLVPMRDLDALAACRGDADGLNTLELGLTLNLYPFVFDVPSRTVRSRCFALDLGDFEDPATGSAAGPLVAYLQDILDVDRIEIHQGVEMGRPSLIEARMDSGRPRVSGKVQVVMSGRVTLPE
ncbi:MAG: PhzF family phenazine biosynthesis protein [Solirubrobacterales bacterium]|nr:PhzF family phenazine biosynthesis protein [Solirubrobacterales bacterium]MCB0860168.1 PhzF family phenazine biosynthesis protein [Solirubrobacterales bacterium]